MSDFINLWLPDKKMITGIASISDSEITVYKAKTSVAATVLIILVALVFGVIIGIGRNFIGAWPRWASGTLFAAVIGAAVGILFTTVSGKASMKKTLENPEAAVVLYRLQFAGIANTRVDKFRINPNAYYITMQDGAEFICIFTNPKNTCAYLDSLLQRR